MVLLVRLEVASQHAASTNGSGAHCSGSGLSGEHVGSLRPQLTIGKNSLLPNAVGHEHIQQMVGDLIELLNLLDVSSHDGLLFLEHSDGAEHLHVHETPIQIRENAWLAHIVYGVNYLVLLTGSRSS